MLWGEFPWTQQPTKLNKLLSMGAVARTVTHCLNNLGEVIPYTPPAQATPEHREAYLATFLRSVDLLWADLYAATEPALRLRQQLRLDCPALLFAGGALPKGAEAMLFPWQQLLTPADTELLEWQLLQRVDGATTVERLTKELAASQHDDVEVRTALWRLHVEGILMFKRGDTESKVVEQATNDEGL